MFRKKIAKIRGKTFDDIFFINIGTKYQFLEQNILSENELPDFFVDWFSFAIIVCTQDTLI